MMNLAKMLEKYYKVVLFLLFCLALTLRWLYLPQNAISFAYDQARDAFVVREILDGHIKILGPSVSGVPGLYHGVLYYYVIAPAYYFGKGNPIVVAYLLSFISSFGVFVIYYLTKLLIRNKIPALIAALIFAVSFESTQYANLMTNASMGAWFVPILYIGLYLWINKTSKWGPVITAVGLGFSIQSEIALAYHFFPIAAWVYLFRKNITLKQILVFVVVLTVAVSSMLVSEIKFGFTGLHGIAYLFSGNDGITKSKGLSDYLTTLIDQSGKTFAYTLFPVSIVLGGIFGFLEIVVSLLTELDVIKRNVLTWNTFLISWIFAYACALPFGGWNMKHILVGVAPAVAIFTGIFIWKNFWNSRILFIAILFVILVTNILMVVKENKFGQTIFPLQPDLTLKNEINAIEFTYRQSKSKVFSISSLSSPLFVNTLWSYLYNWHGKSKYGYLPYWYGRDQVGQLGNNLEKYNGNNTKHFFIIEPTYGIPEIWVTYAQGDQNTFSKYVDQVGFGDLKVQERGVITQTKK